MEDGLCSSCSWRSTRWAGPVGAHMWVRLVSCPSSLGRLPVNALEIAALWSERKEHSNAGEPARYGLLRLVMKQAQQGRPDALALTSE